MSQDIPRASNSVEIMRVWFIFFRIRAVAGDVGCVKISKLAFLNTSKEIKNTVSTFNDSVSEILTAYCVSL